MLGVVHPASLQISAIEAPRSNAQEDAMPLVECALTPRGHGKRRAWYAKTIASTFQWASLCLETAFPFCCPPEALCAVHVNVKGKDGTEQSSGWVCLLPGQRLQVHPLIPKRRGGNFGHISRPGSEDKVRVSWSKF